MTDFFQLVIAGLATGAIYALAAIGFTLLWQTSQTINFAQGEFVMLPAFFALAAMKFFGFPFWAACLTSIVVAVLLLGMAFKVIVVDPMLKQGVLPLVIAEGAGAEMRQALGTAVFFGMLGVTFFGVIFTPVFYVVIRKIVERLRRPSHVAEVQPAPQATAAV